MGTELPNTYRAETRPAPAPTSWTHAELLLSSRSLGWHGIVVEVFRAREVEVAAQYPEHVVSMILKGSIDLYQRRNARASQKTMQPGDIIVTPVGEPKLLRHEEEADVLKLRLAPAFVDSIVGDMSAGLRATVELIDNFGTRDEYIEGIARRLLAELQNDGFASRIYVDALTNELAIHLLRNYSTVPKLGQASSTRLPRYKLQRATDYINDNLGEDLTLGSISETLSMSPFHFAHVFKETVGVTPHRYIIQSRMEKARSLLRETDLSITQIAHQVGYASQSHFTTVFRKSIGQTPRGYRSNA